MSKISNSEGKSEKSKSNPNIQGYLILKEEIDFEGKTDKKWKNYEFD